MTEDQLSNLWAFARGETPGTVFEQWFFKQEELEGQLGEELHFELLSSPYGDREQVWKLRKSLMTALEPLRRCECPTIRDMSAIPMGGDFYFEKVFEPLEEVIRYGPERWWLYISRCGTCSTNWLVAQDERIYDEFFMKRLSDAEVERAKAGQWPEQFQSYGDVLSVGCATSNPPRFLDPMAASLIWTAEDLLRERSDIKTQEVARVLGLSDRHAERLVERAKGHSDNAKWSFVGRLLESVGLRTRRR